MPPENHKPRVLTEEEKKMIKRARELAGIFKEEALKSDAKIDLGIIKVPVADLLDVGFDEMVNGLDKDPDQLKKWLETAYNATAYALGYTENPKGE